MLLYEQNEDELSEFSRFYQEFPVDSPYIRPLGWANKHRKQLRPSKESSNSKDWPQLLAKIIIHKNRLPVPLEAFNRTSCFSPGMKLEAVDWKEPDKIRVATVIAVKDNQIKLHYDGFPTEMEEWFDVDGKEIFAPGYCDTTGHQLEKPVELDISQAAPALLCPIPTACFHTSHTSSSSSPIPSLLPPVKPDSPIHEEPTSPLLHPVVQELKSKVTVTLHISHISSHGPYLDPQLFKHIPSMIGPTTPSQAQALLLTHLLNASVNRQLLWQMIEDDPVPNSIALLYEPNSCISKFLPNIESFHELFNFLNKLREKLDFGPDFIRIGAPPANHEVQQEKIISTIPPLTLPHSKTVIPTLVQPHSLPNLHSNINIPMVYPRNNEIYAVDPSSMLMRQPIHNLATHSPPNNATIIHNNPRISLQQPPVMQVPANCHIQSVETHTTASTCVIPPPTNFVNGLPHSPSLTVNSHNTDPATWTVDQVCDFIGTIDQTNVDDIVTKFRENLIDGACLMDLKVELLVNYLKLELGPAIKISKRIDQLFSLSSRQEMLVSSK